MISCNTRLLCGVLAAFLAAGAGEMCLDTLDAKAAQIEPVATVEAVASVPAVKIWDEPEEDQEEEDPQEDEKITAALVEQGYYREDVPLPYELQDHLHTACETYGVPYELGLGLIETESGFDPDASNGRCYGFTQLNTKYFPADLEPWENIWKGMEYLGYQLGRYDTVEAALEAYHSGHDTGARGYANAVLAAAERWK